MRVNEEKVGVPVGLPTSRIVWAAVFAAILGIFSSLSPTGPAYASHFISVEADVEVFDDSGTPKARLSLTHKWTSSGSFTPIVKNPSGTTITSSLSQSGGSRTQALDSEGNAISGQYTQEYVYNLSGLTTAGVYTIEGSSCCRISSFNTSGSGNFSFEVGFYFDPADSDGWGGSPEFTSSLLTTISKGNDFEQNLGGSSRNGLSLRYSFVTAAGDNGVTVPSGITIGTTSGVLDIPGSTTTTIGNTHSKFGLKLKLEELDGSNNVVGYVTRDIGYNLTTGTPPTFSVEDSDGNALASGDTVSLAAGSTTTVVVSATGTAAPTFTTSNLPNSGDSSWIGGDSSQSTSGSTRTWNLILAPPGATSAQTRPVEFVATSSGLATSFTLNVTVTPARPTVDTVGDGQLSLSWVAATGDNVLGYQVRYGIDGSGTWSLAPVVAVGTTTQTVNGLTNGSSYVFQVATRTQADGQPAGTANAISDGDYSPSSLPATPGLPTNTSVPTISPSTNLGVGSSLTASDPDSSWSNPVSGALSTPSFQWKRDGVDISGATEATYQVAVADIGARITVTSSRSNSVGSSSGTSAQTDQVLARAVLSGLTVSSGTLSPAFSANQRTYSVLVANEVSTIQLTPTVAGSEQVTVEGTSVASGSASPEIALSVGSNPISIVVVDGGSGKFTITVTVTRGAAVAQAPAQSSPSVVTPSTSPPLLGRIPARTPLPDVGVPRIQQGPVLRGNVPPAPPVAPVATVGGRTITTQTQVTSPTGFNLRTGVLNLGLEVEEDQGAVRQDSAGGLDIEVKKGSTAAVSGSGFLPRSTVQVFLPLQGTNAKEIARIPVDEGGTFSGDAVFATRVNERPLPIGKQVLQVVSLDEDGQQSVVEMTVNIAQPAPAPEPDRTVGGTPELRPGQFLATNAGEPELVTVVPVPETRQARVEGSGWQMAVDIPSDNGGVSASDDGGALLQLVRDETAVVSGTGFMAGTRADVWLFSEPTLLGTVEIDENGNFSGEVNIDANVVAVGEHTLQLQGVGEDGYVRAANLGVVVNDIAVDVTTEDAAGGFLWWLWILVVLVAVFVWFVLWRYRRRNA